MLALSSKPTFVTFENTCIFLSGNLILALVLILKYLLHPEFTQFLPSEMSDTNK